VYPISRTLLTDINCSMLAVALSSSPALLVLTSLLLTMTGNASLIGNWKYRNKIYHSVGFISTWPRMVIKT